jgi:hypothetical protein
VRTGIRGWIEDREANLIATPPISLKIAGVAVYEMLRSACPTGPHSPVISRPNAPNRAVSVDGLCDRR